MLESRAVEIISSPLHVEVLYDGQPVWIKAVNKDTDMAEVMFFGSQETAIVPIYMLKETGYITE